MADKKFEGLGCPFLEMHLFLVVLRYHFFSLELIFLVASLQVANLNVI